LTCLEGLFYGGPYHPISLLKNDRYERIRRLRLIVYHHNLHMWYRVICIGGMGGIGVLLEVLSRWHKRNIWFLHFNCFFISIWWYAQFLKKCKQKFSFQISKIKNFKLKNLKISIFSFQIFMTYFNPNLKIDFFTNFSISYGQFFSKLKKSIKFQKYFFFKIFHFKFSLWHKRNFS
jgi:hypothetical protein